MKTIYDEIEDQAAGIFAIWSGLNNDADRNEDGNIDDFRMRGLLDLLRNSIERLEELAKNHRKLSQKLSLEKID